MQTQCIVLLLAFGFAAASITKEAVSPIEKVITLLEELKETVEGEAKEESKTYDEFACFCKDNTKDKSTAITEGQTTIEEESATIAENTANLAAKETELSELIIEIDTLTREMEEARAQRKKEAAEAAMVIADLGFACDSLEKAIKALEDSRPSLIQFDEIKRTIRKSLALADVLGLAVSPKRKRAINALLQVDQPEAPEGDYEFHSDGIIDILKDLKVDFDADLAEKQEEEEKAQKAHDDLMEEKEAAKKTAEEAKESAEEAIEKHKANIAEAKKNLMDAEATLKDDQLYLKDLTERCELKAREWDQRSQARAGEIEALTKALEIIKGGAADKEAARALLLQNNAPPSTATFVSIHRSLPVMEDDIGDLGMAFVQKSQSPRAHAITLLQKARGGDATTLEQHKQRALSFLVAEGKRLGSSMLIATALKLGPDPFKKVKTLIQKLIERLLAEMAAEAGHKGFCDTELGKATTTRDFEHEKTQKLSAELSQLEVKQEQLEENIETLTKDLEELNKALEEATDQRATEKEDNAAVTKDSTEGKAAIKDAITVLKEFYKNAAKNAVSLLQERASPIDEEGGVGAGGQSQGAYQGNQAQGGGIIAMLEVILSDFGRSVEQTEAAEAEALRVFVLFDRQSKGSISTKETGKEQAEGDLKTTKITIKDTMRDLQDSQSLLDESLKAYEELVPQCIDTGMSYAERVAAREKEIEALKKCLCQLDPDGVEESCA